jgi:hypothetical protein
MRRATLIALATLAVATEARAQYYSPPPARPPAICRGSAFVDIVGTAKRDRLHAFSRATRVWGLGARDRLTGSKTRASCLIGGRGNDILALNTGGGVAYGQQGRDAIGGSQLGDLLFGGPGVDAFASGAGDDKLDTRDRRPELVDCGTGKDIAKADRRDVLIGCESVDITGPKAKRLVPEPARIGPRGIVRVRMTVPKGGGAGAYRLVYTSTADGRSCGGGPREITRFPEPGGRVHRGQRIRIGLRHPPGGWCAGTAHVAVLRSPGQTLPLVGVARFSFAVR